MESGAVQGRGGSHAAQIISLLAERAAATSQLAEALGQPKRNIGFHLKELEKAGLIRVVRTWQVRAITEKYYGRTARLFNFCDVEEARVSDPFMFLREAMSEWTHPGPEGPKAGGSTLRHARIPSRRAEEFWERVLELAGEFGDQEGVTDEKVYGLLGAVFLTDLPELPGDKR